jgi:hypothetical protein
METLLKKTGTSFKVHNTWSLIQTFEEGGREIFKDKIMVVLKKVIKEGTDLGRISKSYIESEDGISWFNYKTKDKTIKVSVVLNCNLNRGTWFKIREIKLV